MLLLVIVLAMPGGIAELLDFKNRRPLESGRAIVPRPELVERLLKAPAKALVGPWGHTYPYTAQPLGLDWAKEEVRWWRHWLSGEATGIMDEPPLRAFMPYQTAREAGASPIPGRWIAAMKPPE